MPKAKVSIDGLRLITYASQGEEQIGMDAELARWSLVRAHPRARMGHVQIGDDEVIVLYESPYNPLPASDEQLVALVEREMAS